MIKANELRIGNLLELLINDEWKPIEILAADHLSHLVNEHPEHGVYTIRPIPLTIAILEKCDFKLEFGYGANFEHSLLPISVGYSNYDYYNMPETPEFELLYNEPQYDEDGDLSPGTRVKQTGLKLQYLHQLQNLYFALTGEELPVNINQTQNAV